MHQMFSALVHEIAQQNPAVDYGIISTGGPYAVIAVLIAVVKFLYTELRDERKGRLADKEKHDHEKQALNDRVLSVSQTTMKAIMESNDTQMRLVNLLSTSEEQSK